MGDHCLKVSPKDSLGGDLEGLKQCPPPIRRGLPTSTFDSKTAFRRKVGPKDSIGGDLA
jgi:hypothetical protein